MHTLPRSMCSFVKYWWSVGIWACSLFLSLTVWYTYRLVTLTLFLWIFQGIQYAPRRNVKLKTELIDVDLVRGKSERERDLSIDEFVKKDDIKTCIFILIHLDKCGDFLSMPREIGKLSREYLMPVYFNCLNRFNLFQSKAPSVLDLYCSQGSMQGCVLSPLLSMVSSTK